MDIAAREAPGSAEEAAELLRACARNGTGVRIVGAGTKRGWGTPVAEDLVELDTRGLGALVEHNRGDLTAVIQPGLSLRALDEALAEAGQMLALDPPRGDGDAATIGGAVATGDSGPLRHRYGAPRDLVLGMTVALSDGTVARAGGKVIKNVAGYDLAKLFSGSFGTLGLIVELAVRLHPRPPATATAIAETDDPAALAAASAALAHSSLETQALDVRFRDLRGTVLARFAGTAAAEQAHDAERLLADAGLEARTSDDDEELWARQRAGQRSREGGAVVRLAGRPTQLADACAAVTAAGPGATLVGRGALGVSWIALPAAPPEEMVTAIGRLREALAPAPCVLLDAPAAVRASLDPWDHPYDGALALMRSVKARSTRRARATRASSSEGSMPQTPIDRAFDDQRPPKQELVDDCVHCGICLPDLPDLRALAGRRWTPRAGASCRSSPGLEEGSALTATMVDHFDRCLGCMACVTACPSGVRYDLLIEDTRAQVERRHPRSARERLLRRAVFATFPHPGRLRPRSRSSPRTGARGWPRGWRAHGCWTACRRCARSPSWRRPSRCATSPGAYRR